MAVLDGIGKVSVAALIDAGLLNAETSLFVLVFDGKNTRDDLADPRGTLKIVVVFGLVVNGQTRDIAG